MDFIIIIFGTAHEYSGPAGVRAHLMPMPRRIDRAGARATKTARAGGGRGPICLADVTKGYAANLRRRRATNVRPISPMP